MEPINYDDVKKMNDAGLGYRGPMLHWLLKGDANMRIRLQSCEDNVAEGKMIRIDEDGDKQGYWLA